MEEMLKQVLSEIKELKQGQKNLENKFDDRFESLNNKLNDRFNKIDKKLDVVYDITAELLEFKTEATQKIKILESGKK